MQINFVGLKNEILVSFFMFDEIIIFSANEWGDAEDYSQ